jgi:hypothetical protein
MAATEAPAVPAGYSDRIRTSLDALAKHGVTEEQVRLKVNMSPAEWERFTQSPEGIKTIEFVSLAEALFVDLHYLITGSRDRMVRFSPCTMTAMVKFQYPESETPS